MFVDNFLWKASDKAKPINMGISEESVIGIFRKSYLNITCFLLHIKTARMENVSKDIGKQLLGRYTFDFSTSAFC